MDLRKEEYNSLQNEVSYRMKQQVDLSIFAITVAATIISIAIGNEGHDGFLYLTPLLILIPTATKTHNLQKNIARLKAYIIYKYENNPHNEERITFDTLLTKVIEKERTNKLHNFLWSLGTLEYIFMAIVSTGMFWYTTYSPAHDDKNKDFPLELWRFLMAISLACIIYVIFLTKNYWEYHHKKRWSVQYYINEFKNAEEIIESTTTQVSDKTSTETVESDSNGSVNNLVSTE